MGDGGDGEGEAEEATGEAAGGSEDFDGRVQDDEESEEAESPHANGGDNSARERDIYENLESLSYGRVAGSQQENGKGTVGQEQGIASGKGETEHQEEEAGDVYRPLRNVIAHLGPDPDAAVSLYFTFVSAFIYSP